MREIGAARPRIHQRALHELRAPRRVERLVGGLIELRAHHRRIRHGQRVAGELGLAIEAGQLIRRDQPAAEGAFRRFVARVQGQRIGARRRCVARKTGRLGRLRALHGAGFQARL